MSCRKDIVEHAYPSRRDYADEEAIDWWRNLHAVPRRRLSDSLLLSQDDGIKVRSMWPTCDVCNKPVETFEQVFDPVSNRVLLTVRCHGEEETMRVGMDQILDLIESGCSGGRAFVRPRIPEQRKLR